MSPLFSNTAENFRGGNIACYTASWAQVSRDPWILSSVQGVFLPLLDWPDQGRPPFPYRLSPQEVGFVDGEIHKLETKGIIERVEPVMGQFISNIFLRPKGSGGFRMILDLTELNKCLAYQQFKMASLQTALEMLREDCWMGSVDLRDAYYSVRIRPEHRILLRFLWKGSLFQFVGMPNGLASAPRVFTKLLVPVFASLREEGCEAFPYIDDSFVVSNTQEGCARALDRLCFMLDDLGFVVHLEKSVLTPTRKLTFLGFNLDSSEMTVTLTGG